MSYTLIASVFLPFVCSAISCILGEKREKIRTPFIIISCFSAFLISVFNLFNCTDLSASLLSFNFTASSFQLIYAVITTFMWFGASLLSPQYFKGHHELSRYYFFFLVTLGATTGVFLSADLITTFVFFELMSFTSYTWVVQDKSKDAVSAGKTYLTIAVIGGMVCLMGLFLLYNLTGTLVISELPVVIKAIPKTPKLYIAAFCILVGFGAKAGLFPLHIWLPKAHPVAPAPASALLSGVLTKTGIFGILIISSKILIEDALWGKTLLILGTITMVLGAVLALFSVNLKRTLACSSLSQIGFITVGISMLVLLGEENALAANGTVLYMLNHSIVKLVLFLSAGAIYLGAHTLDLNKLKGYGRNKPLILVPFLIGALSLAGIPGTCGYIAKTLVHESIVEYAHHGGAIITLVEWLFLFSGGLTAAYMLKLFITIFVMKPTEETPNGHKLSALSVISLWLSAIAIPVIGMLPHKLAEKISLSMIELIGGHHFHHEVHYLAFVNLKGVLISVTIGLVVYFFFIRKALTKEKDGKRIIINPLENKFSLEENVYKPLFRTTIKLFGGIFNFFDKLPDLIIVILSITIFKSAKEHGEGQPRRYSYALGAFIDKHSKHHVDENEETLADYFASISETISQTTSRLSGSFSFSLFMTCFGICLILLYLLFNK